MYVVRDIFTAKPGCASKLADLFKRVFANEPNFRVMTDLIGRYNTVEMEFEVDDLAAYEQQMKEYKEGKLNVDPKLAEEMKGYTELWLTGRREIYQVAK
ncbi:MAG TPA: hypothetical protein ENO21_02950 [Firmicutes bacterium]|nr:hypothetical protein [Bacillota bacterium]